MTTKSETAQGAPPDKALHYDGGKPPLSMLPRSALREISRVFEFGAGKYGRDNWRKGSEWTRYADSALRHLTDWLDGEDNDPESGINHLAHAGCNLMFLLEWIEREVGTDDRWNAPDKPDDT